jgi:hypothetical protein
MVGGACLPPPSPAKIDENLHTAVGIPTSKPARSITNLNENRWDEGYDSDGQIGPFFDAVAEEEDVDIAADDDNLPQSMLEEGGVGAVEAIEEAPADGDGNGIPVWLLSEETIKSLNVDQLKKAIGARGLKPKGKKGDLQQMLRDCMTQGLPIVEAPVANADELSGFPVGSRWELLNPSNTPAQEPVNAFEFRAPTDDPDNMPTVVKQNYDETWDRPVFAGRSGNTDNVRVQGEPRQTFIRNSGLNVNSHPVEWMDAFLPVYDKKSRDPNMTPYHLSVDQLCKWSNEKAMLMQMGTKSRYPEFKPFTTEEFERWLYLFFFNGLNPSPQMEWKLRPEATDPVHSNSFLIRVFGTNAPRRFREWKACFACQDPKIAIPSRKTHPNFKIDEVLRHFQTVFRYAWLPGRDLSGDQQTIGFKGHHKDKLRISYKKEGDGFQCDCLADAGYTFTFYMRNQPAPKKYLEKGWSPLHSRIFALYDCLMDNFHQIRFDNLYMSAKFCLRSYGGGCDQKQPERASKADCSA